MADAPISSGESPPPPQQAQPEGGSISSMVLLPHHLAACCCGSGLHPLGRVLRRREGRRRQGCPRRRCHLSHLICLRGSLCVLNGCVLRLCNRLRPRSYRQGDPEDLEWAKKEYSVHEQMVFGKIKGAISLYVECLMLLAEGVVMAIMHPGIAAGSVTLAGIVLFKSNMVFLHLYLTLSSQAFDGPRSYLIQRVRRMFVSKETLLSGVQAEVNHMRQTVNLVSNESQKLMDRAATAEKRFQKGHDFLREEGRAIQNELNQISDIERQAVGLKGILDQLPRAHASEFRSEISGLASQVKKEKRLLNTALSKIVNYGVPIRLSLQFVLRDCFS
ncbi:hypothetical protein PR202_gb05953 [Eleusine coracana subsp. coracana]|uniref:Uncharacterized protein n=1 Tax=Eleusine coracana subsp. coracana TaxID=191504 RepID=A0AAV5E818_ELECO|nr:hypothetical protein PR202_gb05953 [Eleusine coracana subsp. coracana]